MANQKRVPVRLSKFSMRFLKKSTIEVRRTTVQYQYDTSRLNSENKNVLETNNGQWCFVLSANGQFISLLVARTDSLAFTGTPEFT
jgi:hypothetical protein